MSQAQEIWDCLQNKVEELNNTWDTLKIDTLAQNQVKSKTFRVIQREIEEMYPGEKFDKK